MQKAQTIQIFLPDGNPTSIKIADLTNRMITAVLFPRTKLLEVGKRDEVKRYGVYFLFGDNDEKAKPIAYIGETDNCFERIKAHDSKKNFWNYAVVVSSKANTFTKSHVKYLEYLCLKIAREIGRYELNNQNLPAKPHISESLEADLMDNYETIKVLLATLGYPIFEEISKASVKEKQLLYCKGKDAIAEGDMSNEGFIVFKGSKANVVETNTIGSSSSNLRRKLVDAKILVRKGNVYIFVEDYVFKSPSAAADTVLARSANGWTEWKNHEGKTIDEIYRNDTNTTKQNRVKEQKK
jgi:hypothetical protein